MADLNVRIYTFKTGIVFMNIVEVISDSPFFRDRFSSIPGITVGRSSAEAYIKGIQVAAVFAGKSVSVDGEFYTGKDSWLSYVNNVLLKYGAKWGMALV